MASDSLPSPACEASPGRDSLLSQGEGGWAGAASFPKSDWLSKALFTPGNSLSFTATP